jgi:uncharacterized metal-binding protein YceD (DUF177 family)
MKFGIETFTIEHVKLKIGEHEFQYEVNKTFFEHFGYVDLIDACFKTTVKLNKSENMMICDIQSLGWMSFDCDRCLAPVKYPMDSFIKVIYYLNSEEDGSGESGQLDLDLVYLRPSEFSINIAQYIYESFLTAIPMIRNCDELDEKLCDFEMLKKIEGVDIKEQKEGEEHIIDPRWQKLKELLNNKED